MRWESRVATRSRVLALLLVLGAMVWAGAARPALAEERAPGFNLPARGGQRVSLEGLKGEKATILFFQEGPGWEACVRQLVELQRGYPKIKALGAEVLVVGVDPVKAWDRIAEEHKLTLKILADEGRAVSKAYGVLGLPSTMHPDRPGHTFLIVDRQGIIRWKLDVPDMGLMRTQAILDQLTRLNAQEKWMRKSRPLFDSGLWRREGRDTR